MAKGSGIGPTHLAQLNDYYGAVPGIVAVQTDTTSSTYQLFPGGCPWAIRVTRVRGIMTGAGASSDTVTVQDGDGNAISNTIDVSALSDKATFEESSIDDAYWDINKGENLKVVTESSALAYVIVEFFRRD